MFNRKDKVKFSSIAPNILPPIIDGVVTNIDSYEDAIIREPNLNVINSQVYDSISASVQDITDDDFFIIKDGTQVRVIASKWIDAATVTTPPTTKNIRLDIVGINTADITYITNIMKVKGFAYSLNVL